MLKLGQVLHTPGFAGVAGDEIVKVTSDLLNRHRNGDWGDLVDEDKKMNDDAIIEGQESRVLSKYAVNGRDVYVITEWDRSVTTLLLPSEY